MCGGGSGQISEVIGAVGIARLFMALGLTVSIGGIHVAGSDGQAGELLQGEGVVAQGADVLAGGR